MIDQVLNIEEEFSAWFKFADDMGASVGINPDKPRTAKCWSNFKNNVSSTDNESYHRRYIAIPVMVNLINNLEDRMADRSHTEPISLLPLVCLSKQFDIDLTVNKLIKNFGNGLQCIVPTVFRSELKFWVKQ